MATLKIPVTKAGRTLDVDTDALPEESYRIALEEGLKVLLNKGMSKITTKGLEGSDLDKAKEAAFAKGTENLEACMAGKIKRGRAAAKDASGAKVPGVVMTEARRLAKEVVKNELRAAGIKISHVEASEITKAANELLAVEPSFIEQAKTNTDRLAVKLDPPIWVDVNYDTQVVESGVLHLYPDVYNRNKDALVRLRKTLHDNGITQVDDGTLNQLLGRVTRKEEFIVSLADLKAGRAFEVGKNAPLVDTVAPKPEA